MSITLSRARVNRILAVCKTPAAAGRACARIYDLAKTRPEDERGRLLWLSNALNEHRHAILCSFVLDEDGQREHTASREAHLRWALR